MRPLTALMVDDNPGDIHLVRTLLHGWTGIEIVSAATLAEARSLLNETAPDVILLDIHLPDSSGLETLWAVLGTAPSAAVIVMTGLDDDEAGVRAIAAGAQDYLVKGRADEAAIRRAIRFAVARQGASERFAEPFRQLCQMISDPVAVTDAAFRVTHANAAFRALIDVADGDILGRTLADLLPALSGYAELLDSGRVGTITELSLDVDQRELECHVLVYPQAPGIPGGLICVF